MARPIETQLSQLLRESNRAFLGYNPIKSQEIYSAVKNQFPDLCDDNYLCPHYGNQRSIRPEWHHLVRSYRNSLKKKGLAIRTGNYAEWMFLPPV